MNYIKGVLRRAVTRLKTSMTNANTSRRWISAPPRWKLNPRSHKIRTTTKIVQSISFPFLRSMGTTA